MHDLKDSNSSEKTKIENTNNRFIGKLKSLKERKNQRIVVEVLMFISIVSRGYYISAMALLSWSIYLLMNMPYLWKESKLTFSVYLIIFIIAASLSILSIIGIIKLRKFENVFFILL